MVEAIISAVGGLFQIVLKIFGWGAEAAERKRKEAEAVVNEVLKYENNVDNASKVRVEHDRLNASLEAAHRAKFEEKQPTKE